MLRLVAAGDEEDRRGGGLLQVGEMRTALVVLGGFEFQIADVWPAAPAAG
jgi:hypothetical protein